MDSLETTFTNYQISFPRDMGHVLLRNMLIGIPTLLIALILSNPVYCIGFYLVVKGIIKVFRLIPSDIVDKGLDKVHRFIRNDRPPIDIAYNKLKNYRQYPDVASYISSYRKKLRALEDEKERLRKINFTIIVLFSVSVIFVWLFRLTAATH